MACIKEDKKIGTRCELYSFELSGVMLSLLTRLGIEDINARLGYCMRTTNDGIVCSIPLSYEDQGKFHP